MTNLERLERLAAEGDQDAQEALFTERIRRGELGQRPGETIRYRRIAEQIERGKITQLKLDKPRSLKAKTIKITKKSFEDLNDIMHFKRLEKLDLSGSGVRDLSPLTALGPHLKALVLGEVHVSAVSLQQCLTAHPGCEVGFVLAGTYHPLDAEVIVITPKRFAKLSNVEHFRRLKKLDLNGTRVRDLSPLASLARLTWLDLSRTSVSDLTPLAALPNLTELFLGGSQVNDLAPLAALPRLQHLYLWDTQVQDVSPLASLVSLQSLDLRNTSVKDLTPLSELSQMNWLRLRGTRVEHLPFDGLTELAYLNLEETSVNTQTIEAFQNMHPDCELIT